jgi:C-terminal processing protease CtpA/Prc
MGITITAKVLGLKVDETTGKIYRVEKVVIDSFAETSLAKEQLQVGDEILSLTIDGVKKEVTRIHHIIDHMLTARLGSELTLEIIRAGAPLTVTLIVTQAAFTVVKEVICNQ